MKFGFSIAFFLATILQLVSFALGNDITVVNDHVFADGDVTVAWDLTFGSGITRFVIVLVPDVEQPIDRSPLFGTSFTPGEFTFSLQGIQIQESIFFEAVEWTLDDTLGEVLARTDPIQVEQSA